MLGDGRTEPTFPSVPIHTLARFLLFFYAAWTLRVVLLMPVDAFIENAVAQALWANTLRVALWAMPVVFMLVWVHRVRVAHALALDTVPRGRALLLGCLIGGGWIVITALFGTLVEKRELLFARGPSVVEIAIIIVFIVWAPIIEEIVFRGYVYRALRGHMTWWTAAIVSALLFAAAHWPGWFYMQGANLSIVQQTISIAIIGFVLAASFEYSGSLWAPIMIHLLNNLLWAGLPD